LCRRRAPLMAMEEMKRVHWVPLESNPEMLSTFAHGVGLPEMWEFCDVFGTDEELLAMVPQPCVAVTLLFKQSEKLRAFKSAQYEQLDKAQKDNAGQAVSSDIFYMKQHIGNACGTIATIHSCLNNRELLGVPAESPMGKFFERAKAMTPHESGLALAEASDIHTASESSSQGGQTEAPEADADVDNHFICFVEKEGELYELDGGKAFPINHGSTGGDLLKASTRAIKTKFMDVDPENIHFNIMALVAKQ